MHCAHTCLAIMSTLLFAAIVLSADSDEGKFEKIVQKVVTKHVGWQDEKEKSLPDRHVAKEMSKMHGNQSVKQAMKQLREDRVKKNHEKQTSSSHIVNHNHKE